MTSDITAPANEVSSVATADAPAAIGPYSQGVSAGRLVFVSGQLPIDPATGQIPGDIEAQAAQSIRNIAAVLTAAGGTLHDVVKTTVLMADLAQFDVVNMVYGTFFDGPVLPARATYQVARLPKDAAVEIEAIAVLSQN
ncbi:Rid family detoxifying hydrolase [Gordonia sp. DT30]|uniref:Rid family detoxifying hydrolase n=1 Tax=Gordonia sp. DT30 TaxID=3416546 RepID=UPI003CF88964